MKKIDQLVLDSKKLLDEFESKIANDMRSKIDGIEDDHRARFNAFKTSCLNFIGKIEGEKSGYYNDFVSNTKNHNEISVKYCYNLLLRLHDDIKNGWIGNLRDLISADLFSDFIEMADYLIAESFKDPAAVILGSVLEEQLRELCKKNNIDTVMNKNGKNIPKKASIMNDELAANNVYNKLIQKSVTSWLDLRNSAAHGLFNEYNLEQVKAMLLGIQNFISIQNGNIF